MNTTTIASLLPNIIPHKVFFGYFSPNWPEISDRQYARKQQFHKNRVTRQETGEESVSNTSIETTTTDLDRDSVATENNEPMLTEIGRRVLEYKKKIAARMIKQNRGIMLIFGRGDLVWLLFSTKLRLSTKPKKISCRILECSRKVSLWYFLFSGFY
jgi:hypothetical protein